MAKEGCLPELPIWRAKSSREFISLSFGAWITIITEPKIVNRQPILPNIFNFSPRNFTANKVLINIQEQWLFTRKAV